MQDPNEKPEAENEDYAFLQETIKKESVRKKTAKKIGKTALGGALFGACACLAFCALKTPLESRFHQNTNTVTIPEDGTGQSEEQETQSDAQQGTVDAGDQAGTADSSGRTDQTGQTGQAEQSEAQERELTQEDYADVVEKLNQASSEVRKSIVTITQADTTAGGPVEKEAGGSASGILIADNGQELLVLTENSVTDGADSWLIRMADGSSQQAALKARDKNTGLAVLSISRSQITSESWEAIETAMLGNSNTVSIREPVLAWSRESGNAQRQSFGTIQDESHQVTITDMELDVLPTDMTFTQTENGALFNLRGEVVGLVMPNMKEAGDTAASDDAAGKNDAVVYGISDLKSTIQLLSNGKSVPYIGIRGKMVDETTEQAEGVPEGFYVTEVAADSPAMAAGIQSGDILTKLGASEITSFDGYHNTLLNTKTGDELKITGQRRGNDGYKEIEFVAKVGSRD